jgi:DNA-binding transcriptional regulator YiaG
METIIIDDEGKLTKEGLIEMGIRLKEVRKYFSMSIDKFAKHCDVSPSTLKRWYNGARPSTEKNKKSFNHLIETYHINKEWLFYGKGSIFDNRGKPNLKI